MSNKDTYRFVADKINEIQPLADDLGEMLDDLKHALPRSVSPGAAHLDSVIGRALELLESISKGIDAIQYELSRRNKVQNRPPYRPTSDSLRQVRTITIQPCTLGDSEVTIDDMVPFYLSANQAALLEVLARDTGDKNRRRTNDSLVPYKKIHYIILSIAKMLEREPLSEHALRMTICRLRKALAENGFDGLIQTNRQKKAYRVALRRKNHPRTGGNSNTTSKS
jgi:hypothetical protein